MPCRCARRHCGNTSGVFHRYVYDSKTDRPGCGAHMFSGSRGFGMTMGREVVALSTYFGTYHKMREHSNSLASGGVAGLTN